MRGYLLDTNAVCDWLDATKPRHAAVLERARQIARSDAIVLTSAVVLGELEYGIEVAPADRRRALDELRRQVEAQFVRSRLLLQVTPETAAVYGNIRARLFERFAPRERRRKGLRAEELIDPATSKELGIQENDLWIAAQAIERNFVLVSNDSHMKRIGDVVGELRAEDWAGASP